jgi:hypothetical protein
VLPPRGPIPTLLAPEIATVVATTILPCESAATAPWTALSAAPSNSGLLKNRERTANLPPGYIAARQQFGVPPPNGPERLNQLRAAIAET